MSEVAHPGAKLKPVDLLNLRFSLRTGCVNRMAYRWIVAGPIIRHLVNPFDLHAAYSYPISQVDDA